MIFNDLLDNASLGINEIKLKDLITLRSNVSSKKIITTMFPPIEIGSITLVDQVVLLSLTDIIKPKSIVEVGTYLGYTTSLFAMNTDAKIYSIDLPKSDSIENLSFEENKILFDGDHNDDFLRKKQYDDGEIYIKELSSEAQSKISLIKADSTKINFTNEFTSCEFCFIDGGHETEIVKSDTENARACISEGVIVWHDFGSKIHNDVTSYLKTQKDRKIFHVIGSLCAFEII